MNDLGNALIVLFIGIAIFLILYVFSLFTYEIENNILKMHWKLFGFIPFGSRSIRIQDIQEIRRFKLKDDFICGSIVFGNLLIRRGIVIVLKKGFFFMKRFFITPKDPEILIEQIKKTSKNI